MRNDLAIGLSPRIHVTNQTLFLVRLDITWVKDQLSFVHDLWTLPLLTFTSRNHHSRFESLVGQVCLLFFICSLTVHGSLHFTNGQLAFILVHDRSLLFECLEQTQLRQCLVVHLIP